MDAKWKICGIFKADAQSVAQEIKSLGDSCTAKDLVEFAKKDESSELHKCFEWDDSVAGEKYRLLQAQKVLINLVVTPSVKEDKEPVSYRLFMNTGDNSGKYKPVNVVVQKQDEYRELLEMAKRELLAFKKRYSMIRELSEVFKEIDVL